MRIAAVLVVSAAVCLVVACGGDGSGENGDLPPGPLHWIDADPDWSPDGRQIVYTRGSTDPLEDRFNLRSVNLQSGRERGLTRGGGHRDRDPDWSPDGTSIAFERSLDSGFCDDDDEIFVISAHTRARQTPMRRIGRGCLPAWSPDGSKIAFLRDGDLFVALGAPRAQSRNRRRIVGGEVFDFDWSSDGSQLVVERDNEIWTVGGDGTRLRRLTQSGYAQVAHGPRWSPDGSLILLDRFDEGDEGLWVMRFDGVTEDEIASGEIVERAWSPDGARIAFERTGDPDGLFVIDREGRNERRLPDVGRGSFGGWSPDGRYIAVGGDTRGTLSPDPYPIVVIDVAAGRVTRATQLR